MKRLSVGDAVEFLRSSDGTRVRGTVAALIFRGDPHPGPVGDEAAYRLELSAEDQARIGHPVVISATRVLPVEGQSEDPSNHGGQPIKAETDDFHAHLDVCERCRLQPFNLCFKGLLILEIAWKKSKSLGSSV